MNWITWVNSKSGNRTTRAHAVITEQIADYNGVIAFSSINNRTLCGFTIGDLSSPASKQTPCCQACVKALKP